MTQNKARIRSVKPMMKTNKSFLRILSVLVMAAMLLSVLPASALAASFSAAVKSGKMKVYADANGKMYLGSLPKKTIVTVVDYSGNVAKIKYNGMTGYAKVSDMRSIESFAQEARVTKTSRVYQEASTASASVKVSKGTMVYVLAEKNGVAMIEKGGKVGYMSAANLAYTAYEVPAIKEETSSNVADQSTQEAAKDVISKLPEDVVEQIPGQVIEDLSKNEATTDELESLKAALEAEYARQQAEKQQETKKEETIQEAFTSGKYSNEQLVYLFAVKVMGYNSAAAAGLLANIKAESGFNPNINGDSGTSFGICQWHASRKTRLINWCENNGMDYKSLAGQLYFLKYELETYYPSVNKYMKGVSNDADGAYDAAYYFCYHFEAPANKASKSNSRGNSAKNTYYPKYANLT